ncbi:MAG: restriction endonuclease subunit S [Prevotella sp.]|nr:restriction endonuclease subunit S [Prevotella sp.]
MEYKRLGDYIEPVDERNSKLEIKLSQGICNEKYFQDPRQVAENSAADKIVRRGYFAYNRATTRNGEKISIAYREGPDCTVSSAYQVFRIKDEEKLNPKYLLMWYKRSDFDRYARFRSHGSAHEFFEYDEMCDVYLPLPDIDRQREIVEEYETLSRCIRLNEQMIEKLEATAQALYRKMFVDDIDKENLPEGWRMGTLGEVANIKAGGDKPHDFSEVQTEEYNVPVYANGIENKGIFGFTTKPVITTKSITISARGTIGYCFLRKRPFVPIVRLIVVIPHDEDVTQYLFYYLNNSNIKGSGSVQSQLTVPDMESKNIIIPPVPLIQEFNKQVEIIDNSISFCEKENEKLIELQSLLLAKMGQ